MLDEDQTNTPTDESAATPPVRRRRAASRPAGPPAPVPERVPEPVVPAEPVVEPEAVVEPEPEPELVVEPTVVVEPEPELVVDEAAVVAEPAQPELVADEPVAEAKPKRTRRPKAVEVTDDASEEPVAKPVRRSRKVTEPVTDPEPSTATEDDVAASLAELAKKAGQRQRAEAARADGDGPSTDEVLDSLAAAIGGKLNQDVTATTASDGADDDSDDAAIEEGADAAASEGEDGEPARRRRRRRGGRRRRRSGGGEDSAEADEEGDAAENSDTDDSPAEGEATESGTSEGGTGRRRRRRRRRGEDAGDSDDDSVDVVVRVREPRRRGSVSDEVTGIEGSTRMEAKKQRRREGRAAGRRRTPILSESEFLARRESVDRTMLIRQAEDYSQIAVLEDNILVEHYVDRASAASMIGNIYLGRVQNVLPSMEAAFVDIGRGRNAVLYAGEVDWDSFGVTGADKKVEKVFKSGQSVLVQVSKDPVGAKGARLTSHLSIPGRFIVYSPGGHLSGISRKLPETERKRLKGILDELIDPEASVIVRTAAEGASEEELIHDVNRLKAQWEVLDKKSKTTSAPQLLYAEPDLTVRIVRDLFTADFSKLVIDGNGGPEDAYDTVDAYLQYVAPTLAERIERWDRTEKGDLFSNFRVHEQVSKALERKVFLPSGGSLIIDRTEAMTVVDVNTGKFTGTSGNLEATVTSNNLEAAEEIVRQLRLRDIGGIIVIDFIDMVLPANRELLLRRLVECLGRDRTRHQVTEVTSLGLVQMTRKKIGTGLAEAFTVPCETCKGRGYHVHDVPVATQAPADGGDRDNKRRGGGKAKTTSAKSPGSNKVSSSKSKTSTRRTSSKPEQSKPEPAEVVGDVESASAPAIAETTQTAPAAEPTMSPAPAVEVTESPASVAAEAPRSDAAGTEAPETGAAVE
jgi:ribonuclease E